MTLRPFATFLALALAVPAAASDSADPADVAAAERSFASMGQTEGLGPAFRTWSAEDAVIFAPKPSSAKSVYADPRNRFGSHLVWWPVYAGIARSGDLGFSTGPFDFGGGKGFGWYFTIWRREPDGRWRWVLDHGTPTNEPPPYGRDAPLTAAPLGRSSSRAWDQVRDAEAKLAAALAADARKALPAALWADGRLMRVGPQPAVGRAAFTAAALAGPATLRTTPLGGGSSRAGDLAWTYGAAAWDEKGRAVEGHYVRVWQHRAGGWKMLVDEVTPLPSSPPAKKEAQ